MALRTMGYVTFTVACLAGAAILGVMGLGGSNEAYHDGLSASRATSSTAQPTASPSTQQVATTVVPPPPPPPPPVAITLPGASEDVAAGIGRKLATPLKLSIAFMPPLAEPRQFVWKRGDKAQQPYATPAEVRRRPIARIPTTRPVLPRVHPLFDLPAIVMGSTVALPDQPPLSLLPRLSMPAVPVMLPMLKVPLVTRRPEPLALQGQPALDAQGGSALPVLPALRKTPVGGGRPDPVEIGPILLSQTPPDADPPAPARTLVNRPGMK
jgi:hypothetical protein